MDTLKTYFAGIVYRLSCGRIILPAARRYLAARRRAWLDHVQEIQTQLDAGRARGWNFRYIDGRRRDW